MKKLVALLLVCAAFTGCSQMEQAKEQVKNAPSDFWNSVHYILQFVFDLFTGVLSGWLRGLLGV